MFTAEGHVVHQILAMSKTLKDSKTESLLDL